MTIFNVGSASELYDALSKANGGDEIRLAGGDYGELELGSSAQFSSEVTITSADPDNPVTTTSLFFGMSTLIFFRLCCRAPRMTSASLTILPPTTPLHTPATEYYSMVHHRN